MVKILYDITRRHPTPLCLGQRETPSHQIHELPQGLYSATHISHSLLHLQYYIATASGLSLTSTSPMDSSLLGVTKSSLTFLFFLSVYTQHLFLLGDFRSFKIPYKDQNLYLIPERKTNGKKKKPNKQITGFF